jgi:glycerophosphoryl diester phosphodiesterase
MTLADWPWPAWFAHRGGGGLAPENTLAAFRVGAAHGWRAFECDVKLSADGIAFLLHDTALERTTSGRGTAGDLPWAELSQLDAGSWHGAAWAGEPPASLAAIAHYVLRNGHALNIEIKPTPGSAERTGRVVAAEAARLWSTEPLPPLLSSFERAALAAARDAAPALPRALLLERLHDGWLDAARALGCVAVVTNHQVTDAAAIAAAHSAGLRLACYTVDDVAEAERLLAAGVDGLITDAVDRFVPGAHRVQLR